MKGFFGALEMLCLGALMLLFGLMTYTLVAVGSGTFGRIVEKRETTSDLRVALSYVSMQVRKNDATDSVGVVRSGDGDYLGLRRDYEGEEWETRIFFSDGMLCDGMYLPGEAFDADSGNLIVRLDEFSFEWDGDILTVTAVKNGISRSLSLTLRSEGAA